MNFNQMFFLLLFIFVNTLGATAQEDTDVAKQAPETYEAAVYRISKMNREEKNTMMECPLHGRGKEMPMSDNYRANASDYTTCYEYPFAYQLNYRRYCKVCTKIMAKEAGEDAPVISKATFERCGMHNASLKGNPDYTGSGHEKNPSPETPHAQQYKFKNYCPICTKVVKQQTK